MDLGLFLSGFGDIVRAQLAVELGVIPATSPSAHGRHCGATRPAGSGDLLRMLSALGELEPRFRRSTQQQLLLETVLVRFALLDRTVAIEDVLKGIGGENSPSPAIRGRVQSPPGRRHAAAHARAWRLQRASRGSRSRRAKPHAGSTSRVRHRSGQRRWSNRIRHGAALTGATQRTDCMSGVGPERRRRRLG